MTVIRWSLLALLTGSLACGGTDVSGAVDHANGDGDGNHQAAAAVLRQYSRDGNGDGEESHSEELHEQELLPRISERTGSPGEREDGQQIEQHKIGEAERDTSTGTDCPHSHRSVGASVRIA